MPLDEKALRKPEFVEGIRVRLGDGQEWSFPKPRLRLVPGRAEDGSFELKNRPTFGEHRQADLAAVLAGPKEDADDGLFNWLQARIRLVCGLMLDNYNLEDADLEVLLPYEFGDESITEMWNDIHAAIMGQAPKASTVG